MLLIQLTDGLERFYFLNTYGKKEWKKYCSNLESVNIDSLFNLMVNNLI